MMRIVEQISPMLACNNEQAMKNQYMAWVDSLNNAATRDLQRKGHQGWRNRTTTTYASRMLSKFRTACHARTAAFRSEQ